MKISKRYAILIAATTIFSILSCQIDNKDIEKFGSLTCSVQGGSSSRTIVPDLPGEGYLKCYSYALLATGPNGETLSLSANTSGVFNIESLSPGIWKIEIEAKNSDGITIASASIQPIIEIGKTTSTTILLTPLSGKGILSLEVLWPADKPVDKVEGTLSTEGKSDIVLDFSIREGKASVEETFDSGIYTLKIEASYKSNQAFPPRIETIYIYNGLTSSAQLNLAKPQIRFKLANSWGSGVYDWEHVPDGFLWMTGEAMKNARALVTFQNNLPDYDPKYLLTFTIDKSNPSDIYLIFVILHEADGTIIAKKFFPPYNLTGTIQEGLLPFPKGKMIMDISEWSDLFSSSYLISLGIIMNSEIAQEGSLNSLSLEVYDDYQKAPTQVIQTNTELPQVLKSSSGVSALISLTEFKKLAQKPKNGNERGASEAFLIMRPFNNEEFDTLQQIVGISEPGKSYNLVINGHGTGLAPPSIQQWKTLQKNLRTPDTVFASKNKTLIRHGVDLSKDKAFPPIGNQARLGSCVAFSTAYYCQTYQEAKEHGWDFSSVSWSNNQPSSATNHIMSPAFLYNIINGGRDNGSSYFEAHKTLGELGCASWGIMPYDGYNIDSYTLWPEESAWREAPLYRSSFDQGSGGYLYALIVDTDQELEILCQLLESGIPMSISVDANLYEKLTADDEWNETNYIDPSTNHANTIVGYEL